MSYAETYLGKSLKLRPPPNPPSPTGYQPTYTGSSQPPQLSPQALFDIGESPNYKSKDGSGERLRNEGEVSDGHSSGTDSPFKKRRRTRKGLDKVFECPQEGCGKTYSRAEHLYRHQLNHTPKQIYHCDFPDCTRTFVRQDLCNRHRERHMAMGSQLHQEDSMLGHAYTLPVTETGKPKDVQSIQTSLFGNYEPYGGVTTTGSALPLALSQAGINNQQLRPTAIQPQVYRRGEDFDRTGQVAPPGKPPIITAILWEDEGCRYFQVEARGVCVARREDNHMINGTKLLNVAGITRGRRDAILKSEILKHVVKIGPLHLKGIWIPYERALDFANKEKITEFLYPLFVHNVAALLSHPSNLGRTTAVMAAAERQEQEQNQMRKISAPEVPSRDSTPCPQCFKTIPATRPLISNADYCSCEEVSSHSNGGSQSTQSSQTGQPLRCHDAKNEDPNIHSTNRYVSLSPDPDLDETQQRRLSPIHSDTPFQMRRFLVGSATEGPKHFIGKRNSHDNYSSWDDSLQLGETFIQGHGLDEIRQIVSQNLSRDTARDFSNSKTRKRKGTEPSLHVGFNVHWQLEKFVGEQYGERTRISLASVITLTGSAICAQATTVGEYLQRNWPKTCSILLPLLEKSHNGDRLAEHKDLDVQVTVTHYDRERAAFSVLGEEELCVEIAQQLAWLGSAFCTSVTSRVGRSQTRILSQSQGSQGLTFDIIFKVDDLPDGETSCWHYLFENPAIVYNFPIPRRGDEVGLEIPLDMMATLGGACHAVDFEGGLVLKGFSSMFVPLRHSDDSIQWHFIYNEDDSRLSYQDVDTRCPGRALLDTVNQKSLKQTRAFLGWWGSTTTQLGTKDANYENITWSDTKEPGRSATFSGGSLGFQNFGTGELNFSIGHKDSKLHVSRSGPYQRIIKYASKTPVVLYDPGETDRRAWLVPASGVIAHIAQTRHFRDRFSVQGVLAEIKPTELNLGIYEAAEKMLLENSATVLCHDDLGKPNFYFRDLVLNIWSLLEMMIDKNLKNDASADPEIHATMRTSLRGWEFMDVVDEICLMRTKETYLKKSCGGWPDFARDISAVVLFASGFEDILKPAEGETKGLCHMWKGVPKQKDYLTASVAVLNVLFEQAGSILTRKHLTSTHLQWYRGPILFESCPTSGAFRCDCDRVQRIIKESPTTFGTVVPPGPLKQQGAVIFGQARHPFKQLRSSEPQTKATQLYSQDNGPLVMENEILHSPHSSASTEDGSPGFDSLDFGKTIPTSDDEVHPDIVGHKTKPHWEEEPHYQARPQVRKRVRDDSEYTCQLERDNRRHHRQGLCNNQSHQTSCSCTAVEIKRRMSSSDYRPLEPVHKVRPNHLRKLHRKPAVQFPGRDLGDDKLRNAADAVTEAELPVRLQGKV